jgi:hypothetical protein
MAYRSYQPDRRTKRRRWLLIALTVVAVVSAIAFLVSRQTEQRGTVGFFAAAGEVSLLHGESADLLTDTLTQIGPDLSRPEVIRRLDDMVAITEEAEALLDVTVPAPVAQPYGSLAAASAAWAEGVLEVRRVILGIMDGEIPIGAESELRSTLELLRVGDLGYVQFRNAIGALAPEINAPPFESVVYIVPDPTNPLLYDAQNLTLRILASYNLSARVDIGVVGMVDPAPTGERGGIPVVPFSESIAVNAVVSNTGNEAVSAVAVRLDVLHVDTGEVVTLERVSSEIASGGSTTVSFADLALTPGGLYQATVSVTIEGDNRPDNDAWSMTFIWNAES